jgi:hypothetical protein
MLRLLITRNPLLRTLQPKKKTLLNQAANCPLSKHRSSLKPISRNTEMGFQYTQLETLSHSTSSKISSTTKTDTCLRQLIDTHSPTHLKVRKKKEKKKTKRKKTENEENRRKLSRRGSREEAAAAATAAVS